MSNHSPRVYLNTPDIKPIGTVQDAQGRWRVCVDAGGAGAASGATGVDAFGRSRTSMPTSLFDSKQAFDDQPLLFVTHSVSGGATTYQPLRASTLLSTDGTLGSRALRQTRRYLNYQPGKSQLAFITFNLNGQEAGNTKRVGYFDDSNGIFLQLSDTGYSFVIRSDVGGAASTEIAAQSAWNLDSLDGTGPSGKILDPASVIILVIDFEWLGVGNVRVGFDFGGEVIYAHTFRHSNITSSVYMRTPNLPLRWEIEAGAAAVPGSLEAICCSVSSEGGLNPLCVQRTASRGASGASVNTTPQSVFSIRLKSAYNRTTVFPLNAACVTTDTGVNYLGQLVLNPTFGGALTWNPVTNSPVEFSNTVTTVTGGTVLSEFYGISGAPGKSGAASITTSADLNSVLALASDYAGTSDVVTLAVRTLAGSSASSFYAQIDWLELL